jgi:hypothetical protein
VTAAVRSVPDLVEGVSEQEAEFFPQRQGAGHIGQETFRVRFYSFFTHDF